MYELSWILSKRLRWAREHARVRMRVSPCSRESDELVRHFGHR